MMRYVRLLAGTALLGATAAVPTGAQAGLVGVGGTVQAFYYSGTLAGPAGLNPDGQASSDPAPLTAPVNFSKNVAATDILVSDTQIILHNLSSPPFCRHVAVGTACPDEIDGFDFMFTGEDIQGASVDLASAPGFLPVSGTFENETHFGLQLLSGNEIRVDVTGDAPAVDDMLILDLSFRTLPPPTDTPEPSSLLLLGAALAGLVATRRGPSMIAGGVNHALRQRERA